MSSPVPQPQLSQTAPPATDSNPPVQTSSTIEQNPEQDQDLNVDFEMGEGDENARAQQSSSTLDHEPPTQNGTARGEQAQQQSAPQQVQHAHQNRKDASLREFLGKMDEYAPIIPDAVTSHYLTISGLPPPLPSDPTGTITNSTPLPLARLIALATQKFVADIAADAYQYSRIRASNTSSSAAGGGAVIPGQAGAGGAGGGAAGGGAGGAGEKGGKAAGPQLGVNRAGFGGGGVGGTGQGRTVLTMEDLGMAVGEYGINVRRGEFYR